MGPLGFLGKYFGKCLGKFWIFFENLLAYFWAPWGGPGPPRGPKSGPGTPGIDLKSKKKNQKFGPEVSTIFEILIFVFWGVFKWKIDVFDFSLVWANLG